MLRFRPTTEESTTSSGRTSSGSNRLRWRLWTLLVALGLVLATMRQLNQPEAARRLGQLFSAPAVTAEQPPDQPFILSAVISEVDALESTGIAAKAEAPAKPTEPASTVSTDALAQVQDNTYFRPAETEAWFDLFSRLQQMDDVQLSEATLGELTYTQLLKQPDVYRGKVVTIRGTLRREETERPSENSLGIAAYHRLVIQPSGGGHWPFVVYCLELPNGFPRGDNLQASIAVTGIFFKNWSYAWQDGLGIAPVVLARGIDWQPSVTRSPRRTVTDLGLTKTALAAGVFAVIFVWVVIRNTRRPSHVAESGAAVVLPDDESAVQTVHEQLQRLSESEHHE